MKILCQLVTISATRFFPKNYLLEGKKGYCLHTFKEITIDKELEIDADIKGRVPLYPGIDGCEFEMFLKEDVEEFDLIDFDKIHGDMIILVKRIL